MEMARVAGSEAFVAEVEEVVGSIESEAAATGQVGEEEEERASGLEAERSLRSCCMKAPGQGRSRSPGGTASPMPQMARGLRSGKQEIEMVRGGRA